MANRVPGTSIQCQILGFSCILELSELLPDLGGRAAAFWCPCPFPSVQHFLAEPKLVSPVLPLVRGLDLNCRMLGLCPDDRKDVLLGSGGEKCPTLSPGAQGVLAKPGWVLGWAAGSAPSAVASEGFCTRARQRCLQRVLRGCKLACNLLSVV